MTILSTWHIFCTMPKIYRLLTCVPVTVCLHLIQSGIKCNKFKRISLSQYIAKLYYETLTFSTKDLHFIMIRDLNLPILDMLYTYICTYIRVYIFRNQLPCFKRKLELTFTMSIKSNYQRFTIRKPMKPRKILPNSSTAA